MKLQKLLKKLALPVFALVVVSMLAACSSPSGGGSDSNGGGGGGGNDYTPPALEGDKEYDISLDGLTAQEKAAIEAAIEAAGGTAGETMTGADIEAAKEKLSEAGYTYTEKDGTITIIEKPASSSGSVSPVSSDPLFEISDLTVSATKFEWTEGEWLLKEIEVVSNGNKEYSERKIKADSSGIKFTSIVKTVSGTIPTYATEEQKEYLIASGATISGNHYTITYVYDAKELAERNKNIEYTFEYYIEYSSVKTNADKTKYYWTESGKEDYEDESGNVLESANFTTKYYLKKLSGGTNSGNADKPSIGNTFDVKYKDIFLFKDANVNSETMPLDKFLEMLDTSDYTRSGNTITLTKSGVDIMLTEGGKAENKTYVTFVCYNKKLFRPLTMEEYMTFGSTFFYPADYETDEDAGTKIIILTDDGYKKAKDFFNYEGSTEQHSSEEHSGNSYKGKINSGKIYKVYDNKEYKGAEVSGAAFIAKVLEHGWREGEDYTVDNDEFIITFKGYTPSSDDDSDKPSESITPLSSEPLFAASEVTVAASKIEWTEGEWLLQVIQEELTGDSVGNKHIEEKKIKADSSGIQYTEVKDTTYGTIPSYATEDQLAELEKMGGVISGKQYTLTYFEDEEKLAEENEYIVDEIRYKQDNLKTNADKTKYYWTYTSTHTSSEGTYSITKYLIKKSGNSTPLILPGDIPIRSDGEYEGVLEEKTSDGTVKLYTSVEITYTNPEYLVKMWKSPEMTGEPYKTVTGSLDSMSSSKEGMSYSGTSSDHTFTIKSANGANWDVTIEFSQDSVIQGKLTKTVFPSGIPTEKTYQGIINPDKIYKIYNNESFDEGTEFKGSAFIDKALGSGWQELVDYTVDNENYTITFQANSGSSEGSGSPESPKND